MWKNTLLVLGVAGLPLSASAQWLGGVGYITMEDDALTFDLLGASLGYQFKFGEHLSLVPEVRYAMGIGDQYLTRDIAVETDHFISLSVRGQYDFASGAYLFAVPSYANAQWTSIDYAALTSETRDEWEVGLGVGAGYYFNPYTAVEFSYEAIDFFGGTDVLSIGFRFRF